MNCYELIDHRIKLDTYYNNIVEKLDKIQLGFEQNTLIINNKIDNYCNDVTTNKDKKNICKDIKNIINEQYNEYNLNILKTIISTIKGYRLTKGLPVISKVSESETKTQNHTLPKSAPSNNISEKLQSSSLHKSVKPTKTPPSKYNETTKTPPPQYDEPLFTPVNRFNNITPSAPDFDQINNIAPNIIVPNAPTYNQLFTQHTYIPPITYTPVTVFTHTYPIHRPSSNSPTGTNSYSVPVNDQKVINKYVLDHKKQPVYTTRIEQQKTNTGKKKDNCIII
jgi:hypothetical protein